PENLCVFAHPDPLGVGEKVVLGERKIRRSDHRPQHQPEEPDEPWRQEQVPRHCGRSLAPGAPSPSRPRRAPDRRRAARRTRRLGGGKRGCRPRAGVHAKPSAVVKNCSTASGIDMSPKAMASLRSLSNVRNSSNPAGQSRFSGVEASATLSMYSIAACSPAERDPDSCSRAACDGGMPKEAPSASTASSLLTRWLTISTAVSGSALVEETDHRLAAFIQRLGDSATYGGRWRERLSSDRRV